MGYLPIRVSTLKSDIQLGFDVYIQLPHKVLMYVRGDDDIEPHRIGYLKEKKVRKLYIADADEGMYQEYIDRCLNEAMSDDSVSIDEKADLVVGAGEATAERIYEDPHSKKSYDAAQTTAASLISVLGQNDELLKGIFDHALEDENASDEAIMQKHSVNTSSLCISFAEFLSLPKDSVEFLGVAGLFHDVAFSQFEGTDKKLFFKEIGDMEVSDLTRYKEHPKIGGEILQDKEFASAEVIGLILAHEEKRSGNGFPNKLNTLTPEQEVLSICALYDREITCLKKTRDDVLEDFSMNQIGNYDLSIIKKFKSFVKKAGL
ncbi:MAG: HD domain-containing protein [Halobacteriovoraceae bacterium]|nr:HD domain-containing protein [Halobacteriovoraceae bacterium]